jgi:hypothetical protein
MIIKNCCREEGGFLWKGDLRGQGIRKKGGLLFISLCALLFKFFIACTQVDLA